MRRLRLLLLLCVSAWLAGAAPVQAQQPQVQQRSARLLVAHPVLEGFYRHTVVLASDFGGGRHVGFVVNRPMPFWLTPPSSGDAQAAGRQLHLGGPESTDSLFVLVRSATVPGGRVLSVASNVYLAFDDETFTALMQSHPQNLRFFIGLIVWQPGELEHEIENRVWLATEHDPGMLFGDHPENLWVELLRPLLPYL